MKIKIHDIVIGERIRTSDTDLDTLVASIRQVGLIQPIVINEDYELLSGYRRLMACKTLGWSEIEARVLSTDKDELKQLEIEMQENKGRLSLTPEDYVRYREKKEKILRPPRSSGFLGWIKRTYNRIFSFFKRLFSKS